MDFDSSLFDLPFEDLASLSVDTQQQQAYTASTAPVLEFEDFCSDFAANDFGAKIIDNSAPAWNVDSFFPSIETWNFDCASPARQEDVADKPSGAKAEDNILDTLEQNAFGPLGPYDSSFQGMSNHNMSNDAQVVPDMTPGEANAAEFFLPSFSQSQNYSATKSTNSRQGVSTRPYSWMNGIDYASFGWPARARLPSDPAARQQSLERYRDKKARRFNNSTKVRYEMRKVNADKRPRIKGRFVKPEELQSYLESMPASLS